MLKIDKSIKKGDEGAPDEIIIEDIHCGPYIASLYSSIELSKAWC